MTHLRSERYVTKLCELLMAENIPVTCERRIDFEESVAIFEEDKQKLDIVGLIDILAFC